MDPIYLFPGFSNQMFETVTSSLYSTIDAVSEYIGTRFFAPKTCSIAKIHAYASASDLVGTLSGGLYTVSGGTPSSTAYGGMVAGTVTDPSGAGVITITLGTPCSMVVGNDVCVSIKCTERTSGSVLIEYNTPPYGTMTRPYGLDPSNYHSSKNFLIWLEDSEGNMISPFGGTGVLTQAAINFSSSTDPDEYANKIVVPFAMTVQGLWMRWNAATGPNGLGTIYLKDSGGTDLWSSSAFKLSADNPIGNGIALIRFADVSLAKDDVIYVGYAPNASARDWVKFTWNSSGAKDVDFSSAVSLVYRTDGGAWTEDTTSALPIGLVIAGQYGGGTTITTTRIGGNFPFRWR